MLGREGSQKASKPCTLSWLVFVVLSKATPAQPCQEQAGLSCSSQRRAPLAPPPGKGCCAVNKEVSNVFWISSSITHSPSPPPPGAGTYTLRNASLPRCYQTWRRQCTGRPCPEKQFPVRNFCLVLSSDTERHHLHTTFPDVSHLLCSLQVSTLPGAHNPSSSPCPPSSCMLFVVQANLWGHTLK